jgi:hypothetical protein
MKSSVADRLLGIARTQRLIWPFQFEDGQCPAVGLNEDVGAAGFRKATFDGCRNDPPAQSHGECWLVRKFETPEKRE